MGYQLEHMLTHHRVQCGHEAPVVLEANTTRDEIAQTCTHIRRHTNIAWSEMVLCSLCFTFYCVSSFIWFI